VRRQQRHRQQPAAQPAELSILPHDVTVRDDVGTADLEHFAGVRTFQGRRQVRHHVVNGHRLCQRRDPSRAHHHRQAFDQRLDHLERQTAGAHHDRCSELDDRYTAGAQDGSRFGSTLEMAGERTCLIRQAAQIDDAPDAGTSRRAAEVCGGLPIHLGEIGADRHGMHEVISRVHASEREVQRRLIEAITLDDLCR
jgi:hypothetical protein